MTDVAHVPSRKIASRKILVVEDSEVIRRVICLLLQGEGYDVTATDRGGQALELARRQRPDAVTLDLALIDGDGRELLRRLKHDAETASIPVIVLSAFADALNPSDRWYADDVIMKPFDVDDLLRRLGRVVEPERTTPVDAGPPAW
jgi:CheY-like chemotaxis protein